jgi:hypothetical protein
MLLDDSSVFDNTVFEINEDPIVNTIDTEIAKITTIDNFYKDIDGVMAQLPKMPISLIWEQPDNNKTFIDARKVYRSNMRGTILPYAFDGSLNKLLSTIIEFPPERMGISKEFVVNCFSFTDRFDSFLEENYYGCHRDNHYIPDHNGLKSNGQVALVIFLNEYYEEDEGLNFYNVPHDVEVKIRTRKDRIKKIHTVQGKQNRAVLFDSQFPHGQHTPTNQFKKEMRYTQVIFVPTF